MEQFSYKTMLFMAAIVLVILLSRTIKTRIFNPQNNVHPGMHSISVSPGQMTPMQIHPVASGSSPTPQHNNVGVYYVVNPKC
jgi:hypothetical protein